MFLKYFAFKKSFKGKKITKITMVRYLRRFFLLIRIPKMNVWFKSLPTLLNELITQLTQPFLKKFLNPFTNNLINAESTQYNPFTFLYFYFLYNKKFHKEKSSLKGRIKRKILRKLTKANQLID